MDSVFKTDKKIRLGIWGLGRGRTFVNLCSKLNIEITAGCDLNQSMCDDFRKICPDAFITQDEDEFLAQDFDAVLVATFFFTHTRDSIKALDAGKHVLCEVTSFFTPAEGVQLVEAVERSGKIYALAENYTNRFVKKLWQDGVFGELAYAEFDYVHNCRLLSYSTVFGDPLIPGNVAHSWRSWLNFHYYCTHSLGPVMETTGTRPVQVIAPPSKKVMPGFLPNSEMGSMEPSFVIMDNGGVVRNMMGASTCDSHTRKIWGTRAYVDLTLGDPTVAIGQCGKGPKLKLTRDDPDDLLKLASRYGHNGGDFWVVYDFASAILFGTEPAWNIYAACDVTLAGIMAVKSQYAGGIPVEVPDFRDKAVREQYRNDHFAQEHFDPKKIFPENQNINETKKFSSIIGELDRGVELIISALDGIKLYKYIEDNTSKLAVQSKVREMIRKMPALTKNLEEAKALASLYPDSPAAEALNSYINSAYPEKFEKPDALVAELKNWLVSDGLPSSPQLRMTAEVAELASSDSPILPDGYSIRTFKPGDEDNYIKLMQAAGFTDWSETLCNKALSNALEAGIFFLVDNATDELVGTAMANRINQDYPENGAELGWVAISPSHRAKGLSKPLCQAVINRFHEEGYEKAYLRTDDFRLAAIKTYLDLGWKPFFDCDELKWRWQAIYKKFGMVFNA